MNGESIEKIKNIIETFNEDNYSKEEINNILSKFLELLNNGHIRAAEKINNQWVVNLWVKKGILLLFKYSALTDMSLDSFAFFDKDRLKLKDIKLEDGVRVVPGGSSIRTGCYIAKGVICMPPMYINIGSYIDEGTMIDSHALVGTCAQIGKNVHISAAAQIGGVLEPIGANPVIVEDNVMIGGNCGIYEGVIIKKNAIIGTGVILNSSTKVYDIPNETVLPFPIVIPENAVVVQGSRTIDKPFAKQHGLSISTPIIVKYRDSKSDAKTELESILR